MTSVVRTATDNPALLPGIRAAVSEARDQPVYNIDSVQELVSGSISRQRFTMLFLMAFAALALLLAFVGTYAVIAYSTSRRTPRPDGCLPRRLEYALYSTTTLPVILACPIPQKWEQWNGKVPG